MWYPPASETGTYLWSADFKNGVYDVGGTPTTAAAMFGEDQVNFGTFDPATDIVPGVGAVAMCAPLVVGAATNGLFDGITVLIKFTWDGAGGFSLKTYLTDLPNWTTSREIGRTETQFYLATEAGFLGFESSVPPTGLNTWAFTLGADRVVGSSNHAQPASLASSLSASAPNTMAFSFETSIAQLVIEQIDVYTIMPDNQLAALTAR